MFVLLKKKKPIEMGFIYYFIHKSNHKYFFIFIHFIRNIFINFI